MFWANEVDSNLPTKEDTIWVLRWRLLPMLPIKVEHSAAFDFQTLAILMIL